MLEIILSWLILTMAIWVSAAILPGFEVERFGGALVVAAIFGVLNWAIGWLLYAAIGVATLGLGFVLTFLTRWFVTAILLKLADKLSSNLTIRGFAPALWGALVMSLVGTLGEALVRAAS